MVKGALSQPMRMLAQALTLCFALIGPGGEDARGADELSRLRSKVDSAVDKVRPSLVRIQVISSEYEDGREIKRQAVGSGAIITKDGYLITNHHVAGHGKRLFCTLWNREEIEAELVGSDPLADISILKLKPATPRTFIPARFGDSAGLRVGDYVLAMGSPMALSQSVTLGIVSNTEMVLPKFFGPTARFRLDGEDVGSLVRWIAHDAAIYGGNSGGPLVNLKGEIVGINEISYGLGGAIPGNLAKDVAEQLMARGKVARSWLGMDVQPRFKHSDATRGVLISGVLEDSPAERAGLKAGDLLVKLCGKAVDVRYDEQMPEFMRLATSLPIGKPVTATVEREGKETAIQIEPADRGELYAKPREIKRWGITARDLTPLLAREMKRESTAGVLVTSVRPGGPAGEAKPAIDRNDVLVEVNGAAVGNVRELTDLTAKLVEGKVDPVPVVAVFERKAARYLTVVKVGIQELKDPGLEVTKAWLPIETQVISRDIARQLGQPDLKGFCVTRVIPDSAASAAGLKAGDFITAVDGQKLIATGPEHSDELATLIRQYDLGSKLDLTVLRGMKPRKITVELTRSPRLPREMKKYRNDDFEFTARDVSFLDTTEEQWSKEQHGALVEEVKSGSWAELGALYAGDLILEVDGQSINSVDALRRKLEQITSEKRRVIVLKVLRGIHTKYLELEPDWSN